MPAGKDNNSKVLHKLRMQATLMQQALRTCICMAEIECIPADDSQLGMRPVSSYQQVMGLHTRAHHTLLVGCCGVLAIKYNMLDTHMGAWSVLQRMVCLVLFRPLKVHAAFCHTLSPAKAAGAHGTYLAAALLTGQPSKPAALPGQPGHQHACISSICSSITGSNGMQART